ncbi:mediator of RNA polymerase II transcription subunit 16 [Maniola jurtina]|uniref:mediator of RNA polymerase II transcription subunit 16 n=1 Tax=Maniola jurtina TaxID=191418 RepID=UPI001E68C0BF|nr:mediator of RNA polymerase II transcription subunit 16 [Maniola jurtina]
MELIYSMRRKPLKCEPPHFDGTTDPEVVRPICTISTCNIIAFSSLTELTDSDGETWGGHVYVCDLDTPWDSHKVTSTVHPVSALEWDGEGKQLLIATTVGEVSVYGQKEYLLNEWTCLYTANFPGESIKKATFFHNGRRVVVLEKKPDAPISDRIQMLRATPTLKGFGGVARSGLCVVTGTGLVGAVTPGEAARAHVVTDCLRAVRSHIATASIAHKNGNLLIAAGWRRGSKRGVHCAVCSVSRPNSTRSAPVSIQLQPLPTVYLLDDDVTPMSISWWLRDDIDSLLIAGTNLTVWKMTERAYPVHKLLSKGPVQGSTTPGGGPKAADCFNTVAWQQAAVWQMEGGDSATHVSAARLPLGAHAILSTPRALHLLARDTHHYLVSRAVVTSGAGAGAAEAAPGAGTPPKKPKYGHGSLPSGASCATVWCVEMSALGGVVVAVDTHSQLHVYKLHQPAPDIPTPLSVQHVTSLLEYSLVSGYDCLDVLMTLKTNIVEAVYERLTESFQRQPPSFQQYYFHSWLKLRIALCSLSPSWQSSAASLTSLQLCYAAWAACSSALRDDKPDCVALLTALLDDHTPSLPEHDKNLLALEAKAEISGEGALQALQPLQALRRPLQRALHTALTALAALQPPNLHQLQHHNGYELWSDPAAITLLRKLVVVARACGRGGEALSRPLARLAAGAPPKPDLLEECACVCAQFPARVWDALPRRCLAAPHAKGWPLYFEYGVEPESLRYVPEPPAYAQSDIAPTLDMDSIRYMYLGGGRRAARWRRCGRCGARALPAAAPARHPLQKAYDGRFIAACRCGGKWTLVSNV